MTRFDEVLVRRLLRLYNPWGSAGIPSGGFWRVMQKHSPISAWHSCEARDTAYDYGRVRFLVEEIQARRMLDPIVLDNFYEGFSPRGLFVVDGHHRLIAAALCKMPRIMAAYHGGRVVLDWLVGRRKTLPCF